MTSVSRKRASLEGRLFELEQLEEGLILRAAQDRIELLRRGDADPRAVLSLVIAKAAAQTA